MGGDEVRAESQVGVLRSHAHGEHWSVGVGVRVRVGDGSSASSEIGKGLALLVHCGKFE